MQVSAGQTKPVKVYPYGLAYTGNFQPSNGRETDGWPSCLQPNIHTMCQADIFSVSTQCDILNAKGDNSWCTV